MANFHLTVKAMSRKGGRSCVAALAYRSATLLVDQRTGETYNYKNKENVIYVEIMIPKNANYWIQKITKECELSRQSALQKFSDIIEASEKRIDARVYREIEFSLPCELSQEQNIAWAKEFILSTCVSKGMVAILNFHFDINEETGQEKPHCHVLLSTRELTENGFGLKNRNWDKEELVEEWREQCAQYQNAALKEHGFDVQVSHLSYADRGLDIDPQPKRGTNIVQMTERGIETDKQKIFDVVRLKNQFKIVKNPEMVFSIVTSKHSTFTRQDIAKVLHRYIDDTDQFQSLLDRLIASKELVSLESMGVHKDINEPAYTTKEMLCIEMNLVKTAEDLAAQKTHGVDSKIIDKVVTKQNEKLIKFGGLSSDQQAAIRHMLSGDQISCVVGFAGAGKTTCLEATKAAWEASGYKILGLAPTGKAARNIEDCGIRAMTIHRFLKAQSNGREQITHKSIVVLDEAGMVDSRRCSELLSIIDKAGAKIVPMGDGHQVQSIEAGPAFRLLTERVKPVVLETIVRQQTEWQRDATRLFGIQQTRSALKLYQENECFTIVQEKIPNFQERDSLLNNFCLSRQISGRIWKEMLEDFRNEAGKGNTFDPKNDFNTLKTHQDFGLFQEWKQTRQDIVKCIIDDYQNQKPELEERGIDVKTLSSSVDEYKTTPSPKSDILQKIETALRQMSYEHMAETRANTRQALVEDWAKNYQDSPDQSHLMLAFTNRDANKLNEAARHHRRGQGKIQGQDYKFTTQQIETDDFGNERRTYHDRTFAKGDRLLFTRNDNSLEVKNGTLGTIVSIGQNKMVVQLDKVGDKEGAKVSFSPNLYPFIDNGWATTIIKAQGVTIDHVKLLASFEQYRNLAYVGMSRHRHTLMIYASSLDFWREDKIIDRLSRVQDKLSGLDYLDIQKIQEKLEEDTNILWHQQKFQQGKDFWNAIKITALDVFNKITDRSLEATVEKEEFRSFDDSEEIRSRDFFKEDISRNVKEAANVIDRQEATVLQQQSIEIKRQQFEKECLALNQDHCSHLGYFLTNRRFPEVNELGWTYWQAERLTKIEGRLYGEALIKNDKKIDQQKLVLKARAELEKNQAAPDYIMSFGKASDLTDFQLKVFEQHVLIHQDRTNRVPEPFELASICKAIKTHDEVMGQKENQPTSKVPDQSSLTQNPDIYRILIEQQAILGHIIKDSMKALYENLQQSAKPISEVHEQDKSKVLHIPDTKNKEQDGISKNKEKTSSLTLESLAIKQSDIQDACSDQLQRLNDKIQKTNNFNQEMAALDLRRQNERGRGMDM